MASGDEARNRPGSQSLEPPVPRPRQGDGPVAGTHTTRPLVARRVAADLDHAQAALKYNALAETLEAGDQGDYPMTADKLLSYESWPDGRGSFPSGKTIAVLARVYGADPADLIDMADNVPAALLTGTSPRTATPYEDRSTSLINSVLAQATVVVAIVAAGIYLTGAIALAFKLWFLKVGWTPVLGQLPENFIIAIAVGQVLLPSIAAGTVLGVATERLKGDFQRIVPEKMLARLNVTNDKRKFWVATAVISLLAGALLGSAPIITLLFTAHVANGVLQSRPEIYGGCSAIMVVLTFCWLCFLLWLYGQPGPSASPGPSPRVTPMIRRILAVASAAIAIGPCVASISGAFLLPDVALCGPTFVGHVRDEARLVPGQMNGNLIGANASWIYIAQFQYNSQDTVFAGTVTAVPASTVRLEAIGQHGGCGDLRNGS
jgi:hypothetical protein